VLRDRYVDNPNIFKIRHYFLYKEEIAKRVKVHLLTARARVLYINRGGIYSVMPLELIKRIEDRI